MNEQDIPIEITAAKLLEWLESRKIVPKNWETTVREIRTRITSALNDMPVHDDLVKLLSGAYINYFHCRQIVEILKTTEKDTKSLFGRYGSQRMTDWQAIVRSYEKDSVYLAEAAQILQRHNVEVPGLRKHRNKVGQLVDEAQQRIKDQLKTEDVLHAERNAICQQLGIKGADLRAEFMSRIRELPSLYEETAAKVAELQKALVYYAEFSGSAEVLPILRHVAARGNTTVYEFVHGEAPLSVEEPLVRLHLTVENAVGGVDDANVGDGGIDFGDLCGAAAASTGDEINFDVVADDDGENNITLDTGDIDWGEIEMVSPETSTNYAGDAIDFEISLEEAGIVVADSGMDGGVARGTDAYSLLDSPAHRDQFFDELYELEAFLLSRRQEFRSEQAQSFVFYLIDVNSRHDVDSVSAMAADVQAVLQLGETEVVEHLHRLKHSPKYADILAGKLHQQVIGVEKSRATRTVLKEKIVALKAEQVSIKPEIVKLITATKALQAQIEGDISKRYKGRIVTLYGGVDFDSFDTR